MPLEDTAMSDTVTNGVNVTKLTEMIAAVRKDASIGDFRFRVRNKWHSCGRSTTSVIGFYGACKEHRAGKKPFILEHDEPEVLLGGDTAPNPVEHLLNALAGCLTGAIVYHAAARGIVVNELESEIEGEIDLRGFMGIDATVKRGYKHISVTFRAKSDATVEELMECAMFSPVYDVVTNGTKVDVKIEKK